MSATLIRSTFSIGLSDINLRCILSVVYCHMTRLDMSRDVSPDEYLGCCDNRQKIIR